MEEKGEKFFHADFFSLKIRIYITTLLGSEKDLLTYVPLSLTPASFLHFSFPSLLIEMVNASREIQLL